MPMQCEVIADFCSHYVFLFYMNKHKGETTIVFPKFEVIADFCQLNCILDLISVCRYLVKVDLVGVC